MIKAIVSALVIYFIDWLNGYSLNSYQLVVCLLLMMIVLTLDSIERRIKYMRIVF